MGLLREGEVKIYTIMLDIVFIAIILVLEIRIVFLIDKIRGIENTNKMLRDRVDELIKNDEVR